MHFVTWRIRASARMYGKMNMTGGSTALLGKTNVTEVPRSGLCPLGTIFAGTQILNGEPIFPWNSSTERSSLTISFRSTWMCAWNMMFTFYQWASLFTFNVCIAVELWIKFPTGATPDRGCPGVPVQGGILIFFISLHGVVTQFVNVSILCVPVHEDTTHQIEHFSG